MKNKIEFFFEKNIYLVLFIIVTAMIHIPIPVIVLEILFGIECVAAFGIFIYAVTKHYKFMSNFVIYFMLFSLALNVSFTRMTLISLKNGELTLLDSPFVSLIFFKDVSYIFEFVMALALWGPLFLILRNFSKTVKKTYIEDGQEYTFMTNNNLYSFNESIAKSFYGNIKALIILTFVNFEGGLLICLLFNKMSMSTALPVVLSITSENLAVYIIPQLIIAEAIYNSFKLQNE